jgi:dipeptidyl aminopeptidase/acylaminoacyl peptidase
MLAAAPEATAGERPADPYAVPRSAIEGQLPPGAHWVSDIAYRSDTGEAGLLDVLYPENPGNSRLPAQVFVHGGGWRSGSKHRPLFILPALRYVRADAPPMLLIHGTDDTTVPVEPLDQFVAAMRDAGHSDLEYLRFEGAGHMVVNQHEAELSSAMSAFFARTLGGREISANE